MATDKLVDFDHVTDYISREAAIKEFCDDCMDREWCKSNGESCSRIKNINSVPAADVVEVVRCKDCVHLCMTGLETWCFFHPQGSLGHDDFCSAGERRADNGK